MILLKNSIFYDIPKTGGSWVSEGLVHFHIGKFVVGTSHKPPQKRDRKFYKRPYSFTFIRNPVDWYGSFYASNVDQKNEKPDNFSNWIREVYSGKEILQRRWTTLTDYLKPFLNCRLIGKSENLKDDLIKFLKICNENFDVGNLLNRADVNISSYKFKISPEDKNLIQKKEKWLLNRYYGKNISTKY